MIDKECALGIFQYLVDSWPDFGTWDESLNLLRAKIAHAYAFDEALFNALL